MKYPSPDHFRRALENRLFESVADLRQVEQLRSEVAFERALARFDYGKWSLKGGYALRLILPISRTTQDLDLVLRQPSIRDLDPQRRAQKLRDAVDEQLSKDLADYFNFEVRQALPISDMDPENLAAIVLIQCRIGHEEFCKIRIDVGVSERETLPTETVCGRDLLGFAEIQNPDIVIRAKEEIFADKLLAYTEQGETGMRWRDLVDMQLLIGKGLDNSKLPVAMKAVEEREDKVYPRVIQRPPNHWGNEYAETAEQCDLPTTLEAAFAQLHAFVQPLLQRYHTSRNDGESH